MQLETIWPEIQHILCRWDWVGKNFQWNIEIQSCCLCVTPRDFNRETGADKSAFQLAGLLMVSLGNLTDRCK